MENNINQECWCESDMYCCHDDDGCCDCCEECPSCGDCLMNCLYDCEL